MCDGAFLKHYLDDQFRLISLRLGRMEHFVAKIDDLKAKLDALKASLDAMDGRDDEDWNNLQAQLAAANDQIARQDADLDAVSATVDDLTARVETHDRDPNFPPAPPAEPTEPTEPPVEPAPPIEPEPPTEPPV